MLCHWDEVPEQPIGTGHLREGWVDLGAASGTVHIGARRQRLAPGAQGMPAHVHDAEEETCLVVAGGGLSWQDGTTYGERRGEDVGWYPRSQKLAVCGFGGPAVLGGIVLRVQPADSRDGEA